MINGKLGAIIVGAGSSNRMHGIDKLFSRIIERPVLAYSLDIMAKYKKIDELVLVLSNENLEDGKRLLDSESTWPSNWKVMKGGLHRMDSVWIGIQALCNVDWVVIHDAARPCITMDLLKNVIKKAEDVGAASVGAFGGSRRRRLCRCLPRVGRGSLGDRRAPAHRWWLHRTMSRAALAHDQRTPIRRKKSIACFAASAHGAWR